MQAHEQTQFLQAVGMFVRKEIENAVSAATEPLRYKINQLEIFIQENNTSGLVERLDEFDKKIAAIPSGRDGAPGENGSNGKDGSNGRDGVDGKDGSPGNDGLSVDADSVNEFVRGCVEDAVSSLPVPLAPICVVGGFIDRSGGLCLSLSNGDVKALGVVVGRDGKDVDIDLVRKALKELFDAIPKPKDGRDGIDGKDGKDGRDGFGFEDMGSKYSEGKFYFVFRRGEEFKQFQAPAIIHQGIWKAERKYERLDTVHYAGSTFIAMQDEPGQPEEKDSGWLLCVKRGRDGKDGKQGKEGPQGTPGKNGRDGRDLTQLAFDGTKG